MAEPTNPADEAATIRAGCRALGIPLDPAWHDAVAFNVRTIASQAELLLEPPLPDALDPAPVFAA